MEAINYDTAAWHDEIVIPRKNSTGTYVVIAIVVVLAAAYIGWSVKEKNKKEEQ